MFKSWIAAIATLAMAPAFASLPDDSSQDESPTLKLRATLYIVSLESDFPQEPDSAFLSRSGSVIHRAPKKFVADAQRQGSAQLNDGRIVMFTRDKNGEPRWKISPYDYPIGRSGCALTPFRSASVDKRLIPLGTKLFIEETVGMELPDGTVHDGVWYAVDTGSAIKRDRVDLFVGSGKAPLEVVNRFGIAHLQKLTVKLAGKMPDCPV